LIKSYIPRIFAVGIYTVNIPQIDGVGYQVFANNVEEVHGIFNVGLTEGKLKVDLPDGKYRNYLNNKYVKVEDGLVKLGQEPIIVKVKK